LSHGLKFAKPMPKKTPSKELLNVLTASTIESLGNIARLRVSQYASDTSGAIGDGAVLLAIAVDTLRMRPDHGGDGFLYIVGLPRGVKKTAYLEHFFGG